MNYQLSPQPFQDILFSEIYVLSFPAVFKRFEKCPKIEKMPLLFAGVRTKPTNQLSDSYQSSIVETIQFI